MSLFQIKVKEWKTLVAKVYTFAACTFEGKNYPEGIETPHARRRKGLARLTYHILFAATVAFTIVYLNPQSPAPQQLKPGEISESDVYSPITADIDPIETPKAQQGELAKKIAPVFDYDDSLIETWLHHWEQAFKIIRKEFYSGGKPSKTPSFLDSVNVRVQEITGQPLNAADLGYLHSKGFSIGLEHTFVKIGEFLLGRLIAPTDLFPSYYSTGIVVRQLNQGLSETLVYDVSRIWSLDQAREFLNHVPVLIKAENLEGTKRVVEMMNHLLVPNLKFNSQLTQKRITNTLGLNKAGTHAVKRGQLLIRRGERVTQQLSDDLTAIRYLLSPPAMAKRFLFLSVILFAFIAILLRVGLTRKGVWYLPLKDAFFFFCITTFTIAIVNFLVPYLKTFFGPFHIRSGFEYLLPVASGGLLIHLMMGKEAALTFAVLVSVVLGYILDKNYYYTVWVFTVTLSAIHTIRSCKQRTDLYKCGLWSGTTGAVLALAFQLIQSYSLQNMDWMAALLTAMLALISGLLAAVVTGSTIPIFEAFLGYTTNLKLLELSNFNHPLLHSLMMKAPGTYHHSVIVGSLAEIAADRVKANSLLARVSSYYHDIGKMSKPLYFIENQSPNDNPHDQLQPSMSAKILFAHVKNGAKMAREHSLGHKITSIIEQHHGTTLISYFFNKAKQAEKPDLDQAHESDFRYPGPKPQTREAAIVMLADACEAATRSISEPTPSKIQTMVRSIINRRFLEQQFTECDLTFKDLNVIEECFTRTLVSLYHHRIEYPGQKKTIPGSVTATIPTAPGAIPLKRVNPEE